MVTIIKPDAIMNWNKKSSREIKVITHDGIFHSDEVFSVALLRFFYKNIYVMRTRDPEILAQATDQPEVFVLDVGEDYNPAKRNFDHHQQDSPEGMATVSMLFQYLLPEFQYDDPLRRVYYRLIRLINDWDLGIIPAPENNTGFFLPVIISGFNRYGMPEQNNQFLKAVDFAYQILGNELNAVKERIRSEKIWREKEILNADTALLKEPCTFWRSIQGSNPQYKFIIQPGENTWNLLSVDSKRYPLPPVTEEEKGVIFQHKKRFLIVFDNFNSILDFFNKHFLDH